MPKLYADAYGLVYKYGWEFVWECFVEDMRKTMKICSSVIDGTRNSCQCKKLLP